MLKAGQTILLPKPGQETHHLWVVVIVPDPVTNDTIIVNLTTQREHSEKTVVLQAGEHPFIKHPTVVHYADARIVDAGLISKFIAVGSCQSHTDCTAELLRKIQEGLLTSLFTPQKVKDYAKRQLSSP